MSCYICNVETWDTVLRAWLMHENISAQVHDEAGLRKLWDEIVDTNHQAYVARYGGDYHAGGAYPLPFSYASWAVGEINRPSKLERYDALREYMHQCAQGPDYEKRPGYYKSRWGLDAMLRDYIVDEFGTDHIKWG